MSDSDLAGCITVGLLFFAILILLAAFIVALCPPVDPYVYAQILLPSGEFIEGKLDGYTRIAGDMLAVTVDGITYNVSPINTALMDEYPAYMEEENNDD